jgi:hypothetical protein
MTSIADQLRAARKFIETPDKWCKGALGMDHGGKPLKSYELGRADRLCGIGACRKTAFSLPISMLRRALPAGFKAIDVYNDAPTTTHADILALFDRAIELAEKEEK